MKTEGIYTARCHSLSGNAPLAIALIIITTFFGGILLDSILGKWVAMSTVLAGPFLTLISVTKIEINIAKNKYRYTISFFGLAFGKWYDLPPLDYISVTTLFNTRQTRVTPHSTIDIGIERKKLQVKLVSTDKDWLTVWEGKSKEEAFVAARFLAQNLSLKTLNATQSPFEWVE